MRAAVLVRFGPPERAFEIRDLPDPQPGSGEIRVRAEAFGLNFADVMARLGMYQDCPPLPAVVGYEAVGVVDAVGDGVTRHAVGDRVVAFTRFGGYASQVVVREDGAARIPERMDAGVATALATQYCTAWYCAEEMVQLHEGDAVLVQAAAGGVGLALVQLARRRGCVVFGTAGSNAKLGLLREQGVQHPIHYGEKDFVEEVRRVVGGRGLDVVFDSIGGSSVRRGLSLLGAGGRMVAFGVAEMAGDKRSAVRAIGALAGFGVRHPVQYISRSQGIIGVNMLRIADGRPEALGRCLRAVVGLAETGEVAPVVGGRFPVEELAAAHRMLGERRSVGKLVVEWGASG